jgi:cytochrome c553
MNIRYLDKNLGFGFLLAAGIASGGWACSSSSSPAKTSTGGSMGVAGQTGGGGVTGTGGAVTGSGGASASATGGGGGGAAAAGGAGGAAVGTAQLPPEGGAAVEAWLTTGAYKQWHCESAAHAARSPSPHGFNRICSNDAIASNATGTAAWPAGAAAVKELYDSATATAPTGYAVYKKKQADSAAGANWYWYERLAGGAVVADGTGDTGPAMSICVGCHAAAGSDTAHTPSVGGRDQVYTPVAATAGAGTAQLPPEGGAAVEAWLTTGAYKQWHCEAAVHAARSPSPHGFNRICSNDAIASNATGTAAWPAGAAAVKELYDSATATTPTGYAVYGKKQADSAAGANWYWYERLPAGGVVADGTGDKGPAMSICVGCHAAAGSDTAHTPSPGGRDEVYTPVPKI